MYLRAFSYDDDIIFYFDRYGNKYVAKGGSLAWRTNNPGLVPLHAMPTLRSIGACGQIAIFSSLQQGERALNHWLHCKKYRRSSLIAVAKHYAPDDPENYLKKLCRLTRLKDTIALSSFSKKQFQRLIWGIKQLAGYSSTGDEQFRLLPKITTRFYSEKAGIETYLVGSDQFLTKNEAIRWVDTHQLDAITVRKNNGTTYLRSRPGHHLHKIHLTQKNYGKDLGFEVIVREIGTKKPNQCIWAFINGIWNSKESALESASQVSASVEGELVWSLINDTKIWPIGDIIESLAFKVGIKSKVIHMAVKFFKFLIKLSLDGSNHPPIVIIVHSQGAMISKLASTYLSPQQRQQLRFFTFGGWAFIPPGMYHQETHNFLSPYDIVAKSGSPDISLFLLQIEEGKRRGLKESDVIEGMITEEEDFYLDTRDPATREAFRKQRRERYLQLMKKASNVTLLYEHAAGPFEHSFGRACYQKKLKEILQKYKTRVS